MLFKDLKDFNIEEDQVLKKSSWLYNGNFI